MLYLSLRGILKYIFLFLGLKLEGVHNLPDNGPVIIASNHISNWDPIFIAIAVKRPIHYMAKAELFDNRLLGRFLYEVNAFPVKRGTVDRRAIRDALNILKKGQVLGMFPEGTRNIEGEEMKYQSGVAMLALKTGSPVVPVACCGTKSKLPVGWFNPVVVTIGRPLKTGQSKGRKINAANLEDFTDQIKEEINSLLYK